MLKQGRSSSSHRRRLALMLTQRLHPLRQMVAFPSSSNYNSSSSSGRQTTVRTGREHHRLQLLPQTAPMMT